MSRLLILTNDPNELKQKILQQDLEREGFHCETVPLQRETVLERMIKRLPDLVLIDLIQRPTPEDSAVQRLFQTEQDFRNIPILFQLPKGKEELLDVSQGPTDFILKPYSHSELLSRIRLILWKHRRISGKETVQHGNLAIDFERYEVMVDGQRIDFTFKEYELLKFLATNPGKVFTRDSLLSKVWGYEYYGGTRTVDVHVRRLRSKIEDSAHQFIETVRGVGYKFLFENGTERQKRQNPRQETKARKPNTKGKRH